MEEKSSVDNMFANISGASAEVSESEKLVTEYKEQLIADKLELDKSIASLEEEKAITQRDISALRNRLFKANEALSRKEQSKVEYDRTIQELQKAANILIEKEAEDQKLSGSRYIARNVTH